MVKAEILSIVLLQLFFLIACKHQTNDDQILVTSHKFITAIKKGDIKDVKNLIGVKLLVIGKDTEILSFDIKECKKLFDTYLPAKEAKVIITDQIDEVGRKLVKVPIFKGYDSTSKLTKATLDIYFGPPNIVPLSKISGYKLDVHHDKKKIILPDSVTIYK